MVPIILIVVVVPLATPAVHLVAVLTTYSSPAASLLDPHLVFVYLFLLLLIVHLLKLSCLACLLLCYYCLKINLNLTPFVCYLNFDIRINQSTWLMILFDLMV